MEVLLIILCQSLPNIVQVLPLPVCPYVNIVTLNPSAHLLINGRISSNTSRCVHFLSNTFSTTSLRFPPIMRISILFCDKGQMILSRPQKLTIFLLIMRRLVDACAPLLLYLLRQAWLLRYYFGKVAVTAFLSSQYNIFYKGLSYRLFDFQNTQTHTILYYQFSFICLGDSLDIFGEFFPISFCNYSIFFIQSYLAIANSFAYILPKKSYASFSFSLIRFAASQFSGESSFGFSINSLSALHSASRVHVGLQSLFIMSKQTSPVVK